MNRLMIRKTLLNSSNMLLLFVSTLFSVTASAQDTLSDAFAAAAICEAAALLQTDLQHPPVYSLAGDGCAELANGELANRDANDMTIFSDAQCQIVMDYHYTSNADYCNYVLDSEALGNAEADPQNLDRWTLSPGTRFDISALSLRGRLQPFTQRISYKQVATPQGECSLEMRIHTVAPNDTGNGSNASPALKPLLAFHGGSWQRRSSGALGIETIATHYANEGYVVFAPFYRLIDTDEGNAACNDASLTDVLQDANDALDWVQANASRYGASGKPVVFGQSAGGHMSAVLAVERPDDVDAAVLFYAPTDFTDFANQILAGEIDSETAQGILDTVVGQTIETVDVNAPLITRNTLPARILDESIATPPFFLLHGMEDEVLPFRQSVRLCDALAGDVESGPASDSVAALFPDDPFRRIVSCGFDGSTLHLVTQGEHALDLCIAEDICLAGTPISARRTGDSIQSMLDWLKVVQADTQEQLPATEAGSNASESTSSGGSMAWGGLLTLLLFSVFRRCSLRAVQANRS